MIVKIGNASLGWEWIDADAVEQGQPADPSLLPADDEFWSIGITMDETDTELRTLIITYAGETHWRGLGPKVEAYLLGPTGQTVDRL